MLMPLIVSYTFRANTLRVYNIVYVYGNMYGGVYGIAQNCAITNRSWPRENGFLTRF